MTRWKMTRKSKLVTVKLDTYESLQNLGTMKDTFDSVIKRLIKDAKKWRFVEDEFFRTLPDYAYNEDSLQLLKAIIEWFREKDLLSEKWEKWFKEKDLI